MGEKIVQQCRGIILDEAKNWAVVSRPYDKFFNEGEVHAAKIDWSTAKVWEKLDGSLMTLYWYNEAWQVATSGTPDGAVEVNGSGKNFNVLFWEVWHELGYEFPINTDLCYMFELMTPLNQIVVRHQKNRLVHHGARFLTDEMDEHYPYNGGECFGWEIAKNFPLTSIDQVIAAANELDPLENEGYIVTDHLFRRIKVKSPAYVAMHHLISNMSKRKLLELLCIGEAPEIVSYYPEWRPAWLELNTKLNTLVRQHESAYSQIKQITDKKEFAMKVTGDFKHPGAFFAVHNGKVKSFREYFTKLNIRALEELIGIKEEHASIESSNSSGEVS